MERIPQGILDARGAERAFRLARHEPAPVLRPFVQYYWTVRWDLPDGRLHEQRVLPNLSVHVVFGDASPGVWGPSHDVFTQRLRGAGRVLGVRLRPGCCRSLVDMPASALADRGLPLGDVLGAAAVRLNSAVRAAPTDADMVALTDAFLVRRGVPAPSPAEARARDAVNRIAADPGITRVAQLSAATGVPVRSLQRLFLDRVGVSPKWAIRVYRLADAAARVATDPVLDYAALAADLGYSDQAHFIRDFTATIGRSPGAYRREVFAPRQERIR